MKTIRLAETLWLLGVLLCTAGVATGCANTRELTTAVVRIQAGTNVVEVTQPKDTTIERLEFDPVTGKMTLYRYASAANAAAIEAARAQAEAQERLLNRALEIGGQLGAAAGRMYGVPVTPPDPTRVPNYRLENSFPLVTTNDVNAGK